MMELLLVFWERGADKVNSDHETKDGCKIMSDCVNWKISSLENVGEDVNYWNQDVSKVFNESKKDMTST